MDFATAEAILAKILDGLPAGLPVYFLVGNNDLTDEDPGTLGRYEQFVAGLRTLTKGRVSDLTGQTAKEQGYTLVGLNSAGFKPQSYADGTSGAFNESLVVSRGSTPNNSQGFYCDELKSGSSGGRADSKTKAMETFIKLVSGSGPYLVFTHEPDLQDPYFPRRVAEKAQGGSCELRSTWLLTEDARTGWMANGLDGPKVVGVFAGHFHDDNPTTYGGPLFNVAVKNLYQASLGQGKNQVRPGGLAPTFVAPPLAVKLQWGSYPNGARGMMFISVNKGVVNANIDPYWTVLGSDCCRASKVGLASKFLRALKIHCGYAFLIALVLTLLLVLIVLLLSGELDPHCKKDATGNIIWRWVRNRFGCVKNTALKLLIDGETDTYSLSKLQFLLWTLATIYGYIYLWIAHSWVQGLPGLPDIADQFPWGVGLSAGTAVASQISQRSVGTKGGGPLKPQLSDLISAGGVIALGRLQFFSWTVVAIWAYLASIIASDPSSVLTLPSIPPNLLLVSGVSSLAYLGARGVSAPGPVITSAQYVKGAGLAGGAATVGTLTLLGSGFSKIAVVVLVPSPTGSAQPDMTKSSVPVVPPPYTLDPSFAVPGNPDYSTRLDIGLTRDPGAGTFRIRVTNQDGKFGEGELIVT